MMMAMGSLVSGFFRFRWTASILAIILLDISTWLAFSEPKNPMMFDNQDKILHMIGFFGLSIIGHISLRFDFFPRAKGRAWLLTSGNFLAWTAYGLFIELVQHNLSYRSASAGDLAADVTGILLGTLFVHLFHIYPRSASQK